MHGKETYRGISAGHRGAHMRKRDVYEYYREEKTNLCNPFWVGACPPLKKTGADNTHCPYKRLRPRCHCCDASVLPSMPMRPGAVLFRFWVLVPKTLYWICPCFVPALSQSSFLSDLGQCYDVSVRQNVRPTLFQTKAFPTPGEPGW